VADDLTVVHIILKHPSADFVAVILEPEVSQVEAHLLCSGDRLTGGLKALVFFRAAFEEEHRASALSPPVG